MKRYRERANDIGVEESERGNLVLLSDVEILRTYFQQAQTEYQEMLDRARKTGDGLRAAIDERDGRIALLMGIRDAAQEIDGMGDFTALNAALDAWDNRDE